MRNLFNIFFLCLIISISATQSLQAEKINKIIISGNERISDETLIVYGEIKKNQDYTQNDIDTIIKNLYDTKFFSNISINLSGGILKINVIENPIINSSAKEYSANKNKNDARSRLFIYSHPFSAF